MAWSANDIPDQSGKIAVITGANSGLGLEASRELARKGATVIMAVRNTEKGEAAAVRIRQDVPEADLRLRKLDLGSLDSVRAFAARMKEEQERVDILLNNAGLMATPAGQTKDGFETQVGTNHLGHFVLTEELMPLLEAAQAGRVVTMTSSARMQGRTLTDEAMRPGDAYSPWRAYGDSKLANYQFGIELARRLGAVGSSVSSLVVHRASHTRTCRWPRSRTPAPASPVASGRWLHATWACRRSAARCRRFGPRQTRRRPTVRSTDPAGTCAAPRSTSEWGTSARSPKRQPRCGR